MSYPTVQHDIAAAIKLWIITDGVEEVKFFGSSLPREDIIAAVNMANREFELGKNTEIMIRFRLSDAKYTKAKFMLKSIVEPYDLFSFEGGAPDPILRWAEQMNFDKPHNEPAIQPGESFVHLTITDKHAGIIGRVTAMLVKKSDNELEAGFAFCNKLDTFSKHTGRMIARQRIREGKKTTLHKYRTFSRFDTVRTYIEQMMAAGKSCLVIGEDRTEIPEWLNPQPHPGIPEPVVEILKKVLSNAALTGEDYCDIKDYLGLTGKHQTKMVLHNDEFNKFSQEDLTS